MKQEEVPGRVAGLQAELKGAAKEIADLKSQLAVAKSQVRVYVVTCSATRTLNFVIQAEGLESRGPLHGHRLAQVG